MEAIQPAREGERVEGQAACLAFWQTLAEDHATQFEAEQIDVAGTAQPSAGDTATAH